MQSNLKEKDKQDYNNFNNIPIDPFIKTRNVLKITDMSLSTLNRKIHRGDFPKPVYSDYGMRFWRLSHITKWQKEREEQERKKHKDHFD